MSLNSIEALVKQVAPLSPDRTLNEVGDAFLADDQEHLLSLPIVGGDQPIGVISRYRMMQVLMKLYGRELHGKRQIVELMNVAPVIVDIRASLEEAAQHIVNNITFPVTEDFIIVEEGRYVGVGVVMDVLSALESAMHRRSEDLAQTLVELKSSQAQLIQSEKMASLGQMVAGVAHEMNTPLGYARANVEMVQEGMAQAQLLITSYENLVSTLLETGTDPKELDAQFEQIAELSQGASSETLQEMQGLVEDTVYGIDHVSELVRNLRNFSRLDQAYVADIDLHESIDSALMIARNVVKHLNVVCGYGSLPTIACSPSQINQVFLNLINNAAQAVGDQGEIRIRTWSDSYSIYAEIEDNGSGIPEGDLGRIFDPFFTTKKVGEGTGLGLSIVYRIIQEHEGDIQVRSTLGEGTTFTIRLPHKSERLREVG